MLRRPKFGRLEEGRQPQCCPPECMRKPPLAMESSLTEDLHSMRPMIGRDGVPAAGVPAAEEGAAPPSASASLSPAPPLLRGPRIEGACLFFRGGPSILLLHRTSFIAAKTSSRTLHAIWGPSARSSGSSLTATPPPPPPPLAFLFFFVFFFFSMENPTVEGEPHSL